jgi:hypothetical protein
MGSEKPELPLREREWPEGCSHLQEAQRGPRREEKACPCLFLALDSRSVFKALNTSRIQEQNSS